MSPVGVLTMPLLSECLETQYDVALKWMPSRASLPARPHSCVTRATGMRCLLDKGMSNCTTTGQRTLSYGVVEVLWLQPSSRLP